VYNIANREQYAARLLGDGRQPWFTAYSDVHAAERGLVYFPYRGVLDKARLPWDSIHPESRAAFEESVACGLAVDRGDVYELTEEGWLFAVNYMYMLMPRSDQEELSKIIAHNYSQGRKPDDIVFFPPDRAVVPAVAAA